jgi:hypothetical protein
MVDAACGATVRVQLKGGDTLEGIVFSSDDRMLALEQQAGADGKATYRILSREAVGDVSLLLPVPTSSAPKAPLPSIDNAVLMEREKQAIQKAMDDAQYIGDGVTAHAQVAASSSRASPPAAPLVPPTVSRLRYPQAIFDALRKTMPCEWSKKDIVVLDEAPPPPTPLLRCTRSRTVFSLWQVTISPPYTPDQCKGSGTLLSRVQKVLGGQLTRLSKEKLLGAPLA